MLFFADFVMKNIINSNKYIYGILSKPILLYNSLYHILFADNVRKTFMTKTEENKKISKKTQAAIVLAIMAVGFVITYLLSYRIDSFWLDLLNHGFLAAVIGGLADWFAVVALFRKPLGIEYRTAILPRNRDRIMNELVGFIGKDLLNPEYIIKSIKNYNLARMVIYYYDKMGGRARFKFTVKELVSQMLDFLDTEKVGRSLAVALKGRRKNFNMARILIQFFEDFIKTSAGDKFIDCLINLVKTIAPELLKRDFVKNLISQNVETIKKRYIKDSQMRELMFDIVDLSGDSLTAKLIKHINRYSEKLLDYDSEERAVLKQFLADKIALLGKRDGYKLKIAQLEHYFFVKKFDFSQNLILLIDKFCKDEANKADLIAEVEKFVDELLNEFTVDKEKQAMLDNFLKNKLVNFLQNNFEWILKYLKDELMKYSNEQFVNIVESRISDDLQMIRINGSIVGAVAGMGLYLISFAVERMCG